MKTIREGTRGCGRRRPGGCYLASEPGDGILPLWVIIDPPVPYNGAHFRGAIQVDLDAVLERLPEDQWLVGASRERSDREKRQSFAWETWGMSLKERKRLGMDVLNGLQLYTAYNVARLGVHLRKLATLKLGKAQGEVPKAFRALQKGDHPQVLACLWRCWTNCPPKQREIAQMHISGAMVSINALTDAFAVNMA